MNLQSALDTARVVDEAQLPEAIHEKANSGPGGSDHLSQGFLTDLGQHRFWHSLLAEMCEQK